MSFKFLIMFIGTLKTYFLKIILPFVVRCNTRACSTHVVYLARKLIASVIGMVLKLLSCNLRCDLRDDARHIAVYCKGCWFKLPVHNGKRLLEPPELQLAFQEILDSALEPALGEKHLAALTAGERTHWALTRRKFFSTGINKASLQAIERAAFVVCLDDEHVRYDPEDSSKLDRWVGISNQLLNTIKCCRPRTCSMDVHTIDGSTNLST